MGRAVKPRQKIFVIVVCITDLEKRKLAQSRKPRQDRKVILTQRSWHLFDLAQDMLGAGNFLKIVLVKPHKIRIQAYAA
jgi:hypothetical protein